MRPTRHDSGPRSGVTLIELLVVMAIAAIVGGMAIASFAAIGRRASREGAAEDIQGMLRRAQVSAVDSGRGAVVRVDPLERSLYGLSSTVEGAWHFEEIVDIGGTDFTPGARRYNGECMGGLDSDDIEEGAVGLCLQFGGGDYVDCGSPPIFNQTDGVRVEAWVCPQASSDMGIMGKADASGGFAMGLQDLGSETFRVQGGFLLDTSPPTVIQLRSVGTIAQDEWSHVAIEFDGYEARLYVNGVLADLDSYRFDEADNPVEDPNTGTSGEEFPLGARILTRRSVPLTIGQAYVWGGAGGGSLEEFDGLIDEPKLLSVAGGQRVNMPEGVPIVASEEAIHFDGQGRLDIAYHAGSVYVGVGDRYQAAELDADLPAGSAGPMSLRPRNPMPAGGGTVLIGRELIGYDTATDLQLNTLDRDLYGTGDANHSEGDPVHFARVVRVTPTGVVERVGGTP